MEISQCLISYLIDIALVTAVDITARAVNTEGAGKDVAQSQEAAVAVVLADNLLVAGAARGAGRTSHGEGGEAESSEDGLDEHVCSVCFWSEVVDTKFYVTVGTHRVYKYIWTIQKIVQEFVETHSKATVSPSYIRFLIAWPKSRFPASKLPTSCKFQPCS